MDCSLVLCQRTPRPQILQRKLSRIATNHKIHESFLPRKFPTIRYVTANFAATILLSVEPYSEAILNAVRVVHCVAKVLKVAV